jgi:hypothetical protein
MKIFSDEKRYHEKVQYREIVIKYHDLLTSSIEGGICYKLTVYARREKFPCPALLTKLSGISFCKYEI